MSADIYAGSQGKHVFVVVTSSAWRRDRPCSGRCPEGRPDVHVFQSYAEAEARQQREMEAGRWAFLIEERVR